MVLVVFGLRNFYFFDRKLYKLKHEIVVCRFGVEATVGSFAGSDLWGVV